MNCMSLSGNPASIYFQQPFFDAEWALHHLVRRFVGAVYSGRTELTRYFNKVRDFILLPKGVRVEAIWTGYVTTGSITVATNITSVSNPYVVACLVSNSSANYGYGNCTLNGAAMTLHCSNYGNPGSAMIWGAVPSGTGAQNVSVSSNTGSEILRMVVYLLSGVNQSTPKLDAQIVSGSNTSLTTPSMSASLQGLILDCGEFNSGTVAANSGQTVTAVNSINSSGSLLPSSVSMTTTWSTTSSSAGRVSAVSLNPA